MSNNISYNNMNNENVTTKSNTLSYVNNGSDICDMTPGSIKLIDQFARIKDSSFNSSANVNQKINQSQIVSEGSKVFTDFSDYLENNMRDYIASDRINEDTNYVGEDKYEFILYSEYTKLFYLLISYRIPDKYLNKLISLIIKCDNFIIIGQAGSCSMYDEFCGNCYKNVIAYGELVTKKCKCDESNILPRNIFIKKDKNNIYIGKKYIERLYQDTLELLLEYNVTVLVEAKIIKEYNFIKQCNIKEI